MNEIRFNRIGEVLEQKKKSAYWLARVLSVSDATTSKWVNQLRQPPLPVLYEIAAALKVEAKTLLVPVSEVSEKLPERFAMIEERRSDFPKKRGRKAKD